MSNTNAFAGPWSALPITLTPWIQDVINSMGHTQMTPVQASTIPLFMQHKDVVVEAVTGSGKTLAFVIPILEKLVRRETKLRKNEIGALVISPTRELASQIHSVFTLFLSSQPGISHSDSPSPSEETLESLRSSNQPDFPPPLLVVSSDTTPAQDVENLLSTGADIVIGTPGRIEELLLGRGKDVVNVKELEVLVLDEADRLLDLGFQNTVTKILKHLPKQRRTGLFSATMTDADALSELVRVGLRNPARVVVKVQTKKVKKKGDASLAQAVEERRTPASLKNFFLVCRPSEKLLQMCRIIQHETTSQESSRFIVYFATCACVDYFYRILPLFLSSNTSLFSLHGHLTPSTRTRTLASFTASACTPTTPSILLATDVAARGLDLPDVDVVLQFDPPVDPKAFSHRCGRTARAGRSGRAWVLLTGREREYVDFMTLRKIPMRERLPFPPTETQDTVDDEAEDPEVEPSVQVIRKKVLTDRALNDKATKAYVSFVRAYTKHEASYIFRLKDLDLIGVAKCFGLLRLPKMPELKDADRDGWQDADLEWSSYAYADKTQEAKRVSEASQKKVQDTENPTKKRSRSDQKLVNAAWSKQSSRKDEREKRREKKERKRRWLKSKEGEPTPKGPDGAKEGGEEDDDWDDLAREERMAKKLKRGDISQASFDQEFTDI